MKMGKTPPIVRQMHSHVHSILIIEIAKRVPGKNLVVGEERRMRMQLNILLFLSENEEVSNHHASRHQIEIGFFSFADSVESVRTRGARIKTNESDTTKQEW